MFDYCGDLSIAHPNHIITFVFCNAFYHISVVMIRDQ